MPLVFALVWYSFEKLLSNVTHLSEWDLNGYQNDFESTSRLKWWFLAVRIIKNHFDFDFCLIVRNHFWQREPKLF